jgi:glutamate synthase domain-containing protein 1
MMRKQREIARRGEKDSSGCAIFGMIDESGRRFTAAAAIRAIANMHERSSGLGGGFAGYGIYPGRADQYALHVMFDDPPALETTRRYLQSVCGVSHEEPIPTRQTEVIRSRPILHRFFLRPSQEARERWYDETEDDVVVRVVMHVNLEIEGAFVVSSGRNMGVFKGVGYPEDIGAFFGLDEYEGHAWIAHGRFPTNTTGWWGGAHPFGLLDWAVVHNGEVSSYGRNRRYLANFGYHCTLHTDTEVICYLCDLLMRKHGLPLDVAARAMAPPFWSQIGRMGAEEASLVRAVRMVYGGALLNGPFSIVVGHSGGMFGLNDRTKLRPMVAARRGDLLYMASEEAAILEVEYSPEKVWHAGGGAPIVGSLRTVDLEEVARTA